MEMDTEEKDFRTDDRVLVSRLMDCDESAWAYVAAEIVAPLAKSARRGIPGIFARNSLPLDGILGKVFLGLRNNNFSVLRNFRYECRFRSFLYWRVYDAARSMVREKNGAVELVLSESAPGDALIGAAASSRELEIRDEVEQANGMLARLWRDNPTYALVLLLRNDLKLSSCEVATLLGKTAGNVDQINCRAQKRMRKYREEEE